MLCLLVRFRIPKAFAVDWLRMSQYLILVMEGQSDPGPREDYQGEVAWVVVRLYEETAHV
jgi:hypothetical protein